MMVRPFWFHLPISFRISCLILSLWFSIAAVFWFQFAPRNQVQYPLGHWYAQLWNHYWNLPLNHKNADSSTTNAVDTSALWTTVNYYNFYNIWWFRVLLLLLSVCIIKMNLFDYIADGLNSAQRQNLYGEKAVCLCLFRVVFDQVE